MAESNMRPQAILIVGTLASAAVVAVGSWIGITLNENSKEFSSAPQLVQVQTLQL